jgi:predicted lipoprotein with Yx(FWY)xxD motif
MSWKNTLRPSIQTTRRRRIPLVPTRFNPVPGRLALGAGAVSLAVTLAACGSSSSGTAAKSSKAPSASASPGITFSTASVPGLGTVVVDGRGRTVYILTSGGHRNLPCTDSSGCTKLWRDLPLPDGTSAAKAGNGIQPSLLRTMKRSDGETYPTCNGWLMYEYAADAGPGQASGQGIKSFGGAWYVLNASGNPVTLRGAGLGYLPTSCNHTSIARLVQNVSQQRIRANLNYLERDSSGRLGTRYEGTQGNATKTVWVKNMLTQYGLTAALQPIPHKKVRNVVATIRASKPTAVFGVGAHVDSINHDDKDGPAPGADDNGSGVVAFMEAARVLASFPKACFKTSIDFVAFNDEEEDMEGSPAYVASLRNKKMMGFINMDMVGYGDTPCIKDRYNDKDREGWLAAKISSVTKTYNIPLKIKLEQYEKGDSDHIAFWEKDIPAIYEEECMHGHQAHSTKDTTERINYDEITLVTQTLVATLAELVSGTNSK